MPRHGGRVFLGPGGANGAIGGLIMELDAGGRLELRRAIAAAEECRQRPIGDGLGIFPIRGQHGQADLGGHRFALGVAGRDGHVGRLARPRRSGRIAVTVALDLHLQIGIDIQPARGLVQANVLITLRVMDVVTGHHACTVGVMSTLVIGHDAHRERETGGHRRGHRNLQAIRPGLQARSAVVE